MAVEVGGEERAREEGFDPSDRRLALTLELARELCGFPRHLSQHTGGFVISRGPLCEIVPIENAAMEDRTVIEWNKDDLEALGLIKVDVLGLGMLTCIRKAFALLDDHRGERWTLGTVPTEDPATYRMIQRGDTVGVFQIESRAQMAMLPRLKPATFYDLVIEVAIVRPGPIQGDMVHPYLRRRQGREPVEYPSDELREVLQKTLGVPLFQEQVMRIAIVAAGFTPAEADQLRRAMASFRSPGTIHSFRDKFIRGMTARGYAADFAERCFRQIEGFGEYGFPESHAASFAHLAYVSSWLKRHHPAVFACALINSQPMGFYAPAQIVRDLRDHGVEVRPADVNRSEWDCTLEGATGIENGTLGVGAGGGREGGGPLALRLGLRLVRGLKEKDAGRVVEGRGGGRVEEARALSGDRRPNRPQGSPYRSPLDLQRRTELSTAVLARLARGDAFGSMGLDRRQAAWAVRALSDAGPLPLFEGVDGGLLGTDTPPGPRQWPRPPRAGSPRDVGGRAGGGRLPRDGPVAQAPPSGAAAPPSGRARRAAGGGARRPGRRGPGRRRRNRAYPATPRQGNRHVRHPGGRDRGGQPRGLPVGVRESAPRHPGLAADALPRQGAEGGRRDPPDRRAGDFAERVAGGAGEGGGRGWVGGCA